MGRAVFSCPGACALLLMTKPDDGALDAVQGGYKHEVREHTQMGITDDVRLQGPTAGDGPRTGIISMTGGESSGV